MGLISQTRKVDVHNADSGTGQRTSAASLSITDSVEDKAVKDSMASSLANIDAKDFATEATLASLNAKDFSTETTLALVKAAVEAIKLQTDKLTFATADLKVVDSSSSAITDLVSSTPAYTTTDLFVQVAIPYVTKLRLNKSFIVTNTGVANSIDIEIRGSVDNGLTFPDIIRAQTLAPGNIMARNDRNYYTNIQILAKSSAVGLTSTVTTQIAAL